MVMRWWMGDRMRARAMVERDVRAGRAIDGNRLSKAGGQAQTSSTVYAAAAGAAPLKANAGTGATQLNATQHSSQKNGLEG